MYLTPEEFERLVDLEVARRCPPRPGVPPKPRFFRILFVTQKGSNVATAIFVFDVPVVPVHPGDMVTSRALAYTVNDVPQPGASPGLTDVSFTVPAPVNPGDVVAGTLMDTNSTGISAAASATGTCPTPGQVPPAPTGFGVTFTA